MIHSELALVGDVGGTNMRLGVGRLNPETRRAQLLGDPEVIATPLDPDHFFASLAEGAKRLIDLYPEIKDGAIGFPGPVAIGPESTTVGPITNIDSMKEQFDLNARLTEQDARLADVHFYAINDAEAATYAAPFVDGVSDPTNQHPLLYVTHSTGIGAEVIRDHQIASRLTGQLGEWGHIPFLLPDGTPTTLELSISGPNIERLYGDGKSVQELGAEVNKYTNRIWKKVGKTFGLGLATTVPIIGQSDIVIGGGVSKDHHRYETALRKELARIVAAMPVGMVDVPRVTFVPRSEVGTFGLVGARYAVEQHRKRAA